MTLSSAPPKRGSWLITLPLIAFVLIGAAWTGAWWYIRTDVERHVDAWFQTEADQGRGHLCPNRAFGGYPFHVTMTCDRPTVVLPTPEGPIHARLQRLELVSLAYRSNHLIVHPTGPLTLEFDGREIGNLAFQTGQASLRESGGRTEVITILNRVTAGRVAGRPEVAAEQLRVAVQALAPGANGLADMNVALAGEQVAAAGARPEQGVTFGLEGVARSWPVRIRMSADGLVADWARGGGSFDLGRLRITRGQGLIAATGKLGFGSNGRPDGEFQANLTDVGALFTGLAIPGVGEPGAMIGPILALVGRPAEFEGRRGTQIVVRVDNGALAIGAVQLGTLPPVF